MGDTVAVCSCFFLMYRLFLRGFNMSIKRNAYPLSRRHCVEEPFPGDPFPHKTA